MDAEARRELVLRHTEEVVTDEELGELLAGDAVPRLYVGYAPTGEMHIGHYTTMRKLVDFLDAGIDVTVLIADLHAHLDDEKSPFDLLEARSDYYQVAIEAMIDAAGGHARQVEFVRGSEFELDSPYTLELYRLATETTSSRAMRAASEVVRQGDAPTVGGLLYPIMQALDVAALDADIAYGGIDQRGIYMLAREILPELGHEKPTCLFAPLLSGLDGGKMSASERTSKVDLTDDPDTIAEKLGDAYCPAGQVEENGILEYLEYLVFPVLADADESFVIDRPDEYGGPITYESYPELEADFLAEELHPADLKPAVATAIADLLAPVRERILDEPSLLATAYPDDYGRA